MDKNIITRELQILLEAINEQFEIIKEYENFIPQIEFDMIMENVRKLYETFHRLQRLNDPLLFVEKKLAGSKEVFKSVTQPEPLVVPMQSEEPKSESPVESITIPEASKEILSAPELLFQAETETEPESLLPNGSGPLAPESKEPSVSHSPQHQPPIQRPVPPAKPAAKKEAQSKPRPATGELELFASEEPVFSIKLKEAREKTFGPKLTGQESFKASIGINDKFMFINELFDGNLREYNENIEALGGFKTLPQAQEHLDMLRRKYNWSSSLPAFTRIKEKVESRF